MELSFCWLHCESAAFRGNFNAPGQWRLAQRQNIIEGKKHAGEAALVKNTLKEEEKCLTTINKVSSSPPSDAHWLPRIQTRVSPDKMGELVSLREFQFEEGLMQELENPANVG